MARRPRKKAGPRRRPRVRKARAQGVGSDQRRPHEAAPPLCAVCMREARGFGYCHGLRHDRHPHYRFCSRRCQDIGADIARRNNGMIDKTARERQAIRDARASFAEALTSLGLMEPFFHRKPEDIDCLIEAAVTGYIDSMGRQAARKERTGTVLDDPLPF